jgi:hypothetical protein
MSGFHQAMRFLPWPPLPAGERIEVRGGCSRSTIIEAGATPP